jgi:hypothetical protein
MNKESSLEQIFSDMSQGANPYPNKSSNWYKFAVTFEMGILDLDEFADLMNYGNFKNLDISISPIRLFQKDNLEFIEALRASSLKVAVSGNEQVKDFFIEYLAWVLS